MHRKDPDKREDTNKRKIPELEIVIAVLYHYNLEINLTSIAVLYA